MRWRHPNIRVVKSIVGDIVAGLFTAIAILFILSFASPPLPFYNALRSHDQRAFANLAVAAFFLSIRFYVLHLAVHPNETSVRRLALVPIFLVMVFTLLSISGLWRVDALSIEFPPLQSEVILISGEQQFVLGFSPGADEYIATHRFWPAKSSMETINGLLWLIFIGDNPAEGVSRGRFGYLYRTELPSFGLLMCPTWVLALPPALFGAVGLANAYKLRRRLNQKQCKACGYDLRESPLRCPKCGSVPMCHKILE